MNIKQNIVLEESPINFMGCLLTEKCNVELHLHNAYEIYMATTPNIRYYIEGQTYDLQEGDIIITNTSEIHRPVTIDSGMYGRNVYLFSPTAFNAYIENRYPVFSIFTQRKKGYGNHLRPTPEDRKEIERFFDKLLTCYEKKDARSNLLATVTALEFFIKLESIYKYCYPQNQPSPSEANKIDPRIQSILDELNRNFIEPFNLDELAKHFYMDKYYMCHQFKKETGFSIMEYIQARRILYAKLLIDNEALTLVEVGQRSGFNDYSNFYKTFKKLVQISPKAYQHRYSPADSHIE